MRHQPTATCPPVPTAQSRLPPSTADRRPPTSDRRPPTHLFFRASRLPGVSFLLGLGEIREQERIYDITFGSPSGHNTTDNPPFGDFLENLRGLSLENFFIKDFLDKKFFGSKNFGTEGGVIFKGLSVVL